MPYFAVYISRTFYPGSSPSTALLATLATFGAGFLTRPIGAIVMGGEGEEVVELEPVADEHGDDVSQGDTWMGGALIRAELPAGEELGHDRSSLGELERWAQDRFAERMTRGRITRRPHVDTPAPRGAEL